MHYFVGDNLASETITVALDPSILEVSDYLGQAEFVFIDPDGNETVVAITGGDRSQGGGAPSSVEFTDGFLSFSFAYDFYLDAPGLWTLRARFAELPDTGGRYLEDIPVVVEDPDSGWHTLDTARQFLDGADLSDVYLYTLLEVAKSEVLAFAPSLTDGTLVPLNYRLAQVMHARNKLNASRVSPGGDSGDGSFALTPFPLDWAIKQTLRPQSAIPRVG